MSSKERTPVGEIKPSENAPLKKALLEGKNSQDDKGLGNTSGSSEAGSNSYAQPSSAQEKDLSQNASSTKKNNEMNSNLVMLIGKNSKPKSSKRKRPRGIASTVIPCPVPDEAKLYVCQDFLKYRCRRGQQCAFLHVKPAKRPMVGDIPVPVDDGVPSLFNSVVKVCRNFIHNMCPSGSDCLLYHPPLEITDGVTETVALFAICKNFLEDSCNNFKCRSVVSLHQYIWLLIITIHFHLLYIQCNTLLYQYWHPSS